MKKRVLVACEYSGTVRDAFSRLGWDAWSCDIIPTESELTIQEGKHILGDVIPVLSDGWDLMIGHPPCNFISFAGTSSWNNPGRVFDRLKALDFFAQLWESPIPHICLENPKSCASPVIAKYSQEIQPYYFGDPVIKTTWLWLKNLPPLSYSENESLFAEKTSVIPTMYHVSSGSNYRSNLIEKNQHRKSKRNAKDRAKFWQGIANAMAEQWIEYINQLA